MHDPDASTMRKKGNLSVNAQSYSLPETLNRTLKVSLADWRAADKIHRLWGHDASLWTGEDEGDWLGWLGVMDQERAGLESVTSFAEEVKGAGFSHAVLLGMGGSSLCPEVMRMTFGRIAGYPELHVLDSTVPAQILTLEKKIDLARTLFIVSSKSGTTLEPNSFLGYFFERVKETVGPAEAGKHFIAITDPKSKLQQIAGSYGFRRLFFGVPSIGGRYSALSHFGIVPAAIMGVDLSRFLDRAGEMADACASDVPVEANSGVVLGAILGSAANQGHDKVTFILSPGIQGLGAWLEQLLAESTGKQGKGLIPVDGEEPGPSAVYGQDRVFAYIRLESSPEASQDRVVEALEKSGQPVIRISVKDIYSLGQEFFRWEIATAVAGSLLGINPFNQPDVEASKRETHRLTAAFAQTGMFPKETPFFNDGDVTFFTDDANASALSGAVGGAPSLDRYLRAHLSRLQPGDYFALLAYLEMNEENEGRLQAIRHAVRNGRRVATCLGFGPRFLHSTGQAYKGGPDQGLFLQVTSDDPLDLPVPGQRLTFGVIKAAQARGDFDVLSSRKRRILRVHLSGDVERGLMKLEETIKKALIDQ